jgi:hypothetical protein
MPLPLGTYEWFCFTQLVSLSLTDGLSDEIISQMDVPCVAKVFPWWHWHPHVGISVAILAAVGVLVPWFAGEIKGGKRALWTLVMFIPVGLEVWSIYMDQIEHDEEQRFERCQDRASFEAIASRINLSITNNQTNFGQTIDKVDGVFQKTKEAANAATEAVNTMTGGKSYIYIALTGSVWGPMKTDSPGAFIKGDLFAEGILHFEGTFPLNNVYIEKRCPDSKDESISVGTVFPQEIGRPRPMFYFTFQPRNSDAGNMCHISINTSNGS